MARAKSDPALDSLAGVDLFAGLSQKELKSVRAQARDARFSAGDVVVAEGDKGGHFHLVLEGTAAVSAGGCERAVLGPGQYFGEVSLIDGGPRTATVTAQTDLSTLSLAIFNFRPLLREHPAIAEKIMVQLCRRLREAELSQIC